MHNVYKITTPTEIAFPQGASNHALSHQGDYGSEGEWIQQSWCAHLRTSSKKSSVLFARKLSFLRVKANRTPSVSAAGQLSWVPSDQQKAHGLGPEGPFFCERGYCVTVRWVCEARDGPKSRRHRVGLLETHTPPFPILTLTHRVTGRDAEEQEPHHHSNQDQAAVSSVPVNASKSATGK